MKATEKAVLTDVRAKYKMAILIVRLSFSHKRAMRYLAKSDMYQGVCFYLQRNTDLENPYCTMHKLMTDAGVHKYYTDAVERKAVYPLKAKSLKELIASLNHRLWILDEILKLKDDE